MVFSHLIVPDGDLESGRVQRLLRLLPVASAPAACAAPSAPTHAAPRCCLHRHRHHRALSSTLLLHSSACHLEPLLLSRARLQINATLASLLSMSRTSAWCWLRKPYSCAVSKVLEYGLIVTPPIPDLCQQPFPDCLGQVHSPFHCLYRALPSHRDLKHLPAKHRSTISRHNLINMI